MKKIFELTLKEFNMITKELLLAGHKELAYELIKTGVNNNGMIKLNDVDEDTFDLIVKLLIISNNEDEQRLGYNLVNENYIRLE